MRGDVISAGVSEKEKKVIQAAARRSGVSTSQFVRDASLRAVRQLMKWEREDPPEGETK